jgi:hypothetical protein
MKKLILVLTLLVFTLTSFSQHWDGFFQPVNKKLLIVPGTRQPATVWLFRPVVTITALQFMFKDPVEVSSLSSMGTGLSFQHLINNDGEPYVNYGFNALLLFTNDIGGVAPASLSFAVTGSFLNYVSVGVGYSLQAKKAFLLTGITYNFNK